MDDETRALLDRAAKLRGERVWFTHRYDKGRRVEMEFFSTSINSVGETFRAVDGSGAWVTLHVANPKLPYWAEWVPDEEGAERICAALGFVRRRAA